jgi:hypothetical protein
MTLVAIGASSLIFLFAMRLRGSAAAKRGTAAVVGNP